MRALLLVACCAAVGCFAPKYNNGQLRCGAGAHPCPDGYSCAANNTCWKTGSMPTLDLAVSTATADLAVPGDLANQPSSIKHQGEACSPIDVCDTGNCVDGYCCNSSCANTCQACNVSGLLGICSNVGLGISPAGMRSCNAQTATSCGRDGTCDGMGNCRDWPSGTTCSTGTCDIASGNFVSPSTCNGSGTCVPNGNGNCEPYKCQDATQCFASCSGSTQCSGSNTCVNMSCGQLPNGRMCSNNNGAMCSSGNCVDGYCCDSDCTSNCQACDVPGSHGLCTTVAAGLPHGTARTCTNQGMSPCGGACDGQTASCSYAVATTPCGTTCSSSTQLQNSFCDHMGSCVPGTPMTCNGSFKCTGSACLTTCSTGSDCDPGYLCSAPVCKRVCVFETDTFDETGSSACVYGP